MSITAKLKRTDLFLAGLSLGLIFSVGFVHGYSPVQQLEISECPQLPFFKDDNMACYMETNQERMLEALLGDMNYITIRYTEEVKPSSIAIPWLYWLEGGCGDVNQDHSITVTDALIIMKRAIGIDEKISCAPPLDVVDVRDYIDSRR
jgi:hypothetical protein